MTFDVEPDAYTRFMGRFSRPLAHEFIALLDVRDGQRALDVGCGPGALTEVLVDRLGESSVSAIDPSEPFVRSVRSRFPLVDCRLAAAEELPFDTGSFDLSVSQLVVHFMDDPVRGIRELARVTRPGGVVAANVWDDADGAGVLAPFGEAQRSLDAAVYDGPPRPGTTKGDLVRIFTDAGLQDMREEVAAVEVRFSSFDEWWEPFTLGVGPVGDYLGSLTTAGLAALRCACADRLPSGSFMRRASAWVAIGRVGET
jgi:SAM-dependent methyltransferase